MHFQYTQTLPKKALYLYQNTKTLLMQHKQDAAKSFRVPKSGNEIFQINVTKKAMKYEMKVLSTIVKMCYTTAKH